MHPGLRPLPAALLRSLGASAGLAQWVRRWPAGAEALALLRAHPPAQPFELALPASGLSLSLLCVNPEARSAEQRWGLNAFTLQAGRWQQGWPAGLEGGHGRPEDVLRALSEPGQEGVCLPGRVLLGLRGLYGQRWALLSTFDPDSLELQTLSLLRAWDWRCLPAIPSETSRGRTRTAAGPRALA